MKILCLHFSVTKMHIYSEMKAAGTSIFKLYSYSTQTYVSGTVRYYWIHALLSTGLSQFPQMQMLDHMKLT